MTAHILPISRFSADPEKCIACGLCVRDCPAGIIVITEQTASIPPENDGDCIGCQHCLAACPTAAVSVMGKKPGDSLSLADFEPDAENLETLMRGRRSVRQFMPEPVPVDVLKRLLEITSYAPTGVNARRRRFTVIRERAVMDAFRERICRKLADSAASIPEEASWMVEMADDWLSGGDDGIFRSAPHLLMASTAADSPCSDVDAVIALSYFDLIAQANGVGTVWAGMVHNILRFFPECREWLGIPADHVIGYAILFGIPTVDYARTAQYGPEEVVMLESLK